MQMDKPSKPTASVFTRIVAAAIDAFIVIITSVVGSFFIYRGALSTNKTLKENVQNQTAHVESSHLAKSTDGNYYSYTSDDYYSQDEEGNYTIIKALSYFYLNYLTNSNIDEGEVGSLDFNQEVEPGIVQKDYYTVSWFNENILKLPKAGETSDVDYFVYQKDGENDDYTKVGTVNPTYIAKVEKDGETTYKVEMSKEMETFTYNAYKEAINILYGQKFFKAWTNSIDLASSLITLFSRLFMVLIMFVLLPLVLKDGKTLGKLLFKMSLSKKDDTPIKKWQVLPRAAFFILIPVAMFFITNAYINIGIIMVLLIASISTMALTKKKTALHDLIAGTIVVDDYYKKKLQEQKELEESMTAEPPLEEEDVELDGFEEPKEEPKEETTEETVEEPKEEKEGE